MCYFNAFFLQFRIGIFIDGFPVCVIWICVNLFGFVYMYGFCYRDFKDFMHTVFNLRYIYISDSDDDSRVYLQCLCTYAIFRLYIKVDAFYTQIQVRLRTTALIYIFMCDCVG